MDKTKIYILLSFILAFVLGILFQRYIGINKILLLLNIKTIEYSDTSDRELININPKKPLVLFIVGQSNVANSTAVFSTPQKEIYNLYKGELYRAKDPLLGATGNMGSIWIPVANRLLSNNQYGSVVLINIARNNSSINDWIDNGKYASLLKQTYISVSDNGFTPDVVMWGQGERDAIDTMNHKEYQDKLQKFIESLAFLHVNRPIIVSVSSRCYLTPPNDAIRNAQLHVISSFDYVLKGPDTDKLDSEFRYDNCHFNYKGSHRLADEWSTIISSALW